MSKARLFELSQFFLRLFCLGARYVPEAQGVAGDKNFLCGTFAD